MRTVNKNQKLAARAKSITKSRKVLGLNASKQIDTQWYYSLDDVESIVAAVLAELDEDPGAGIILGSSETGVVLNVTSTEGDEYSVDVDLTNEGDEGDEAAEPSTEPSTEPEESDKE